MGSSPTDGSTKRSEVEASEKESLPRSLQVEAVTIKTAKTFNTLNFNSCQNNKTMKG